MKFHIDYHTPGSLTKCKTGDNLLQMLHEISREGCRIDPGKFPNVLAWANIAQNGDRYFMGCSCTIRAGDLQMTKYTSF